MSDKTIDRLTERAEIDYQKEGVPVLRAVFTDYKGKPLWTEEPYMFSRMNGVGEVLIHDSKTYVVRRVAVCEGCMYVNFEAKVGGQP